MKKYIILFLMTVSIYSCNDAIDIVQDGELNNDALYTSVENMQLVLNDVYGQMSTTNELLLSSILTDEVGLGEAGFPGDTHSFQIFSTNGSANAIWFQKYQAINRANRLIEGAALYTPNDAEVDEYNNILAQARAIRAFCHFQLLTYFSTDLSDDDALGVMLVDYVPSIEEDLPRSTNGEVFALIESDLLFAENNLTTATSGGTSWYYFNTNVIDAMRARMYLYRENYTLAELYADNVINNSGIVLASSMFTLPANFPTSTDEMSHVGAAGATSLDAAPPTGTIQFALYQMDRWTATSTSPMYKKMWVDADQGEAIFSLGRPNSSTNFGSAYNTNNSSATGAPLWDMGRNLFDLYTEPLGNGAQDFRRWAFVDRSATISTDPLNATRGSENIIIDKYPGKDGAHSANDIKVFRMSEMYFIKAEARVEANDFDSAESLIQDVRQARNYISGTTVPAPNYNDGTEAYADILMERYKELCFEGHRYIDLKRIGAKAGVSGTNRFIADSQNASAENPLNISIGDYRFTLPIPQAELNVNSLPQNPGATY
ncbi:RagB/SusD family nutrient uptake outer membrane protein [Winogradskyella vidalii]|uniref:RagB/SusD family nutrient uptake outer membrane protein n=1 Tax=Winogradskyella vidalii TaxID=2615024 RepID=UPI0015C7091B|nr:RagB/SusD family nutrient uptake outer membrane protein [Winogradskyella vidalii]